FTLGRRNDNLLKRLGLSRPREGRNAGEHRERYGERSEAKPPNHHSVFSLSLKKAPLVRDADAKVRSVSRSKDAHPGRENLALGAAGIAGCFEHRIVGMALYG